MSEWMCTVVMINKQAVQWVYAAFETVAAVSSGCKFDTRRDENIQQQ